VSEWVSEKERERERERFVMRSRTSASSKLYIAEQSSRSPSRLPAECITISWHLSSLTPSSYLLLNFHKTFPFLYIKSTDTWANTNKFNELTRKVLKAYFNIMMNISELALSQYYLNNAKNERIYLLYGAYNGLYNLQIEKKLNRS